MRNAQNGRTTAGDAPSASEVGFQPPLDVQAQQRSNTRTIAQIVDRLERLILQRGAS